MNDDLISREWLLEHHKSQMGFLSIRKLIQDAPAVDAVEVVRCKDCRYCYYDQIYFHYWCERTTGSVLVEADDFCSYGERRTDNG